MIKDKKWNAEVYILQEKWSELSGCHMKLGKYCVFLKAEFTCLAINEGMPVYLNSACIYSFLIIPYNARWKCLWTFQKTGFFVLSQHQLPELWVLWSGTSVFVHLTIFRDRKMKDVLVTALAKSRSDHISSLLNSSFSFFSRNLQTDKRHIYKLGILSHRV